MDDSLFLDHEFLDHVADRLATLPAVQAVTLGGSRAAGTHTAASDWDFALYYRGAFDPEDLRALGWQGSVSDVGGWGGGVFNGGAWLEIDGRKADVHYRDLDVVERELDEARQGRFHIEPLLFHLAGIPSYLLAAELAINRVLRGSLPRPDYPQALRESAPRAWMERAHMTLGYARGAFAGKGKLAETAGSLAVAGAMAGHAVLAVRSEWITNEKRLLERAGLRGLDGIIGALGREPARLEAALEQAAELFDAALAEAGA